MLCGIRVRWLLLGLLCCMPAARAMELVVVTSLPVEARDTLRLIRQGGPFPYARDGAVFHNYEHRLPALPGCTSAPPCRARYHEYTVRTPGANNRGARRIVCGPLPECYYTGDHYRTFSRITGVR